MSRMLATRSSKNEHIHNAVEQGNAVMADNQQVERPAAVTQAKHDSYLRHVRIHIELLQGSLSGREFGCGVGQGDREEIEKRLLDIWSIARAAQLAAVDRPPGPGAPSGDGAPAAPSNQGRNVIPFRPRLAR